VVLAHRHGYHEKRYRLRRSALATSALKGHQQCQNQLFVLPCRGIGDRKRTHGGSLNWSRQMGICSIGDNPSFSRLPLSPNVINIRFQLESHVAGKVLNIVNVFGQFEMQ